MTIRMAQESDIPELAQLYQETVLAIAPHYYSEEQTHSWASFATDSVRFREFILSGKTFLATDETGILGFAGIADDGHITSAYVRRDRTHADYLEC
ncbi:MAG: GNAT family N-acetyltransferase, partial [Coleofasciculus sp.]